MSDMHAHESPLTSGEKKVSPPFMACYRFGSRQKGTYQRFRLTNSDEIRPVALSCAWLKAWVIRKFVETCLKVLGRLYSTVHEGLW